MIMAGGIDATVMVAATRRNAAGADLEGAPGRAVEARLRTHGWAGPRCSAHPRVLRREGPKNMTPRHDAYMTTYTIW